MRRLDRAYRAVTACNSRIVRATDEAELLQGICHDLLETSAYPLVWIGGADPEDRPSIRVIASAGSPDALGYLGELRVRADDSALGQGPTGIAFRERRPEVNRDTIANPAFGPWRNAALAHGFHSSCAVPLIADGRRFGVLAVYAVVRDAFDAEEVALLSRLADDLAFGILALRLRRDLDRRDHFIREITAAIDEVFWLSDNATRRIYFATPSFERIWGRTREELYADPATWHDAIHADDRDRITRRLADMAKGPWREEYRIVRPDGSVRWIRTLAYPVPFPDGIHRRTAGVALDITELRSVEEQLRQAVKMEALGRLAAGVAHDFNKILTVIAACVESAADHAADHDEPPAADREAITRAVRQGAGLTRQLLAFTRQQLMEPRPVDLGAIVESSAGMLRRVLDRGIRLEVLGTRAPGTVLADPGQVEQVLLNLVANANDAMPLGGTLRVDTVAVELDHDDVRDGQLAGRGAYVAMVVADTGVGMDDETRSRVFEPFFTTKEREEGTGLGLSTVLGIAQQSGGFVTVDSVLGQGATVRVHFPRTAEGRYPAGERVSRDPSP